MVDAITQRGGKFYVTVNGVERGFYSREMANRFIGHNALKVANTNQSLWTHNADLINRQLGINTHGSVSNPYYLQGAARQSYVKGYENFWQTALAEQDAAIRASVTDADFSTTYRTINGKPVVPQPKSVPNPVPAPKKKGFLAGITDFLKKPGVKKTGKWAGIALVAGAAIWGLSKLFKGCSDDAAKVPPTTPTEPEQRKTEQPIPTVPPETEKPTVAPFMGVVHNNESIIAIAKRYGVSVEELKELNKDKIRKFHNSMDPNDNNLYDGFLVGEKLVLPANANPGDSERIPETTVKDYEDAIIRNKDKFVKERLDEIATPEFRKQNGFAA